MAKVQQKDTFCTLFSYFFASTFSPEPREIIDKNSSHEVTINHISRPLGKFGEVCKYCVCVVTRGGWWDVGGCPGEDQLSSNLQRPGRQPPPLSRLQGKVTCKPTPTWLTSLTVAWSGDGWDQTQIWWRNSLESINSSALLSYIQL